jgi:hypothetical protein
MKPWKRSEGCRTFNRQPRKRQRPTPDLETLQCLQSNNAAILETEESTEDVDRELETNKANEDLKSLKEDS